MRSLTLRNLQCKKFNWKDLNKLHVYFTLHTDEKKKGVYTYTNINCPVKTGLEDFESGLMQT